MIWLAYYLPCNWRGSCLSLSCAGRLIDLSDIFNSQGNIVARFPIYTLDSAPESKRDGGLNRTRLDERANDFFGTEDLLSQAYEDAVHVGVVAD
jgi:hypothetical protein